MKRKSFTLLSFLCFFTALFLISSPSFAEGLSIQDIVLSGEKNAIALSSVLTGEIDEDLMEPIKSGIPVTFTYHVELYNKKTAWFDKKVREMTIKKSVDYDNLKNEYHLIQTVGKETKNSMSKNFNEVMIWMRRLDKIKIATYDELEYEKKYFIRVKADLKSIKFIFPLNYVLFFFSIFDEDTSWHKSPIFIIKESLEEKQ